MQEQNKVTRCVPYDIARCAGTHHPECQDCLRREPGSEYQWTIAPPEFEEVCPMKVQESEW